jgi:hypothetical protein
MKRGSSGLRTGRGEFEQSGAARRSRIVPPRFRRHHDRRRSFQSQRGQFLSLCCAPVSAETRCAWWPRFSAIFLPDHPCDSAPIPAVETSEGEAQLSPRSHHWPISELESVMKYQATRIEPEYQSKQVHLARGGEERRKLLLEKCLIGAVRFVLRQRAVEILDISGFWEEVVETGLLERFFI